MNTNTKSSNLRNLLGDFDPAEPPPKIDPVPEGVHRPRWSVMIPTFNCAAYLRQTLESVLAQAPGPEEMQIEVIDDCSTQDDPEAVVREIGQGRVIFHRKEKNEGVTPNFNTCIERSQGELVHILHGDDWVLPGFYDEIQRLNELNPEVSLLATRCVFTDEAGRWIRLSPFLPHLAAATKNASDLHIRTEFQCAGVVVKRSFYEEHGGFRTDLIHTADSEMWHRGIRLGGGMVSQKVLACYRVFEGNDTSRLCRTASNLRDRRRLLGILAAEVPDYPRETAKRALISMAQRQWRFFIKTGDREAAAHNARFLVEIGGPRERLRIACETLKWRY